MFPLFWLLPGNSGIRPECGFNLDVRFFWNMCDFYCFVSVEIKMVSHRLKSTSFKVPYLLVFLVIVVYKKNPPRGDRVHVLCVCVIVYIYTQWWRLLWCSEWGPSSSVILPQVRTIKNLHAPHSSPSSSVLPMRLKWSGLLLFVFVWLSVHIPM